MKCNKTQGKWCKNKHGASKIIDTFETYQGCVLMTHKYRGSQQSSREVNPKFIDSTQGEPKNIYKP
jgi:hypothetical protein